MSAPTRLLIVGAGGFAREVAWLAETVAESGPNIQVAGFADDNPELHGQELNGYRVVPLDDARTSLRANAFVIAVGAPKVRERLVSRALALDLEPLSLIHPRVERSRFITMAEGVVICAGCILTTDIKIGAYAQLNLDCTIGHDVIMDDYATLAPGVHVSGNVNLGRRSYVGTGATIINGSPGKPIVVGEDAVVGASACVTKSVTPGVTAVGVPAKELTRC